ncbi:hypothetical protein J8J14_23945 [Roseomonas sp. SSH11]|uniref:Uncharacterized protein n=1 Tax=Pararoseomonas baculiformis TaxID=2820812 RepID=A0ABS4ALA8_9PROT|nr:hypothetical protein [Pararoseomonas baculiformis]MBP0447801.1 hypothetical protein [Pararoseomonas baculiformis]
MVTALGDVPHASETIEVARISAQVRWDIGAAMPDGPEDEPVIHALRAYSQEDGEDGKRILVCLTLGFRTPEPGRTGAVLLYAQGAESRFEPLGLPFHHGLDWLRGQVPLADACEVAATEAVHVEASFEQRDTTP